MLANDISKVQTELCTCPESFPDRKIEATAIAASMALFSVEAVDASQ
jgi:hypothetical protein